MIKTILIFSISLLYATFTIAQEEYMDKIVSDGCSCLEEISDDLTDKGLELQLGLCILKAAGPYQKEILADYGLDLNKANTQGEEIGILIGGKMAAECATVLVALTQRSIPEELPAVALLSMRGTVLDMSTDLLIHFSIKDENGRTEKYYWYSFVDSDIDLIRDYTDLKEKNVSIEYHKEEFFDPKIMEYRPLNIIDVLNVNE